MKEATFKKNKNVWHNLNFLLMIREMMIVLIMENLGIMLKITIKENILSLNKETKRKMEILWTKKPQSVMDLKILDCLFLMLHCLWRLIMWILGSLILMHHSICLVIRIGLMNLMRKLTEHIDGDLKTVAWQVLHGSWPVLGPSRAGTHQGLVRVYGTFNAHPVWGWFHFVWAQHYYIAWLGLICIVFRLSYASIPLWLVWFGSRRRWVSVARYPLGSSLVLVLYHLLFIWMFFFWTWWLLYTWFSMEVLGLVCHSGYALFRLSVNDSFTTCRWCFRTRFWSHFIGPPLVTLVDGLATYLTSKNAVPIPLFLLPVVFINGLALDEQTVVSLHFVHWLSSSWGFNAWLGCGV